MTVGHNIKGTCLNQLYCQHSEPSDGLGTSIGVMWSLAHWMFMVLWVAGVDQTCRYFLRQMWGGWTNTLNHFSPSSSSWAVLSCLWELFQGGLYSVHNKVWMGNACQMTHTTYDNLEFFNKTWSYNMMTSAASYLESWKGLLFFSSVNKC